MNINAIQFFVTITGNVLLRTIRRDISVNAIRDGLGSIANVLIIVIMLPAPIMVNVSLVKMIIFVFATKDILGKHAIPLAFVNRIRA